MPYRVRYERRAKEQLDAFCRTYPEDIAEELLAWLQTIAFAAEDNALDVCSADFIQEVECLLRDLETSDLRYSTRRFTQSTFIQRIRAILATITKRRPPWQLRHAIYALPVFHVVVDVHVICEIDNVNRWVIVRKFIDLPGVE